MDHILTGSEPLPQGLGHKAMTDQYIPPSGGTVDVVARAREDGVQKVWLEFPSGDRGHMTHKELRALVADGRWQPVD